MSAQGHTIQYHENHIKFLLMIPKDKKTSKYTSVEEIIQFKEQKNIDVNYADWDSRTALHVAAAENRKEVVLYLLKEGAESKMDDWEDHPIDCTTSDEIKLILGEDGPDLRMGPGRIILYTWFCDIAGVSRCLKKYGSVAARFADHDDRTALHIACSKEKTENFEIVRRLLANGANPMAKDREGNTPIDDARALNLVTFIELMESSSNTTPAEISVPIEEPKTIRLVHKR